MLQRHEILEIAKKPKAKPTWKLEKNSFDPQRKHMEEKKNS